MSAAGKPAVAKDKVWRQITRMIFRPALLAFAAVLSGLCAPALASSSPWIALEGARVRLVTSGKAGTDGVLRGVLEIKLSSGWKTYWRDPGDAGVPPTIDVSGSTNIEMAELDFPTPKRHDEGDFSWAGYDRPVSLPVRFAVTDPAQPASIKANIFLGVCETICVPVKADIAIDTMADPDNQDDAAIVSEAFAQLPPAATPEFGLRTVGFEADKLTVEATLPAGAEDADIFLAGEADYAFEEPKRWQKDGRTFFTIPATRPDTAPKAGGLHYTLVTSVGAVNGILPFF